MAMGSWIIEAILKLNNSAFVSGMSSATRSMTRAQIEMDVLSGKTDRLTARTDKLALSMAAAREETNRMINSGAAVGFIAIAAGIGYAVDQAAKLQQTLLAIKNETGATASQMGGYYNTIFDIANRMGVTPNEAGKVALDTSRLMAGTIVGGRMVNGRYVGGHAITASEIQSATVAAADFASMVHFNRPDVSVDSAAGAGIRAAHMFRAYSPAELNPMYDQVYRLSGMMRESLDQALTQLSYFEPLFATSKISVQDSVGLVAFLNRMGFRQKAGTGIADLLIQGLGPLQQTKHFEEGQGRILKDMGILDKSGKFRMLNAQGGVDFMGMLTAIASYSRKERQSGKSIADVEREIQGALKIQGGRIAELFADPRAIQILAGLRDWQKNPNTSLATGMRNRNDSVAYQFQRSVANINALFTELGGSSMWLAPVLKNFADSLHNLQEFLRGHSVIENAIGAIAAGLGAFLGTVTAVGAVSQMLRFLGIIKEVPNAFSVTMKPIQLMVKWLRLLGPAADAAAGAEGAAAGGGIMGLVGALQTLSGVVVPVLASLAFWAGIYENLHDKGTRAKQDAQATNPNALGPSGLSGTQPTDIYGNIIRKSSQVKSGPFGGPVAPVVNHFHFHHGAIQAPGGDHKKIADAVVEGVKTALRNGQSAIKQSPWNPSIPATVQYGLG